MWKNTVQPKQTTDENIFTAHAHCMMDNQGYRHTIRICNNYYSSRATMATWIVIEKCFIGVPPNSFTQCYLCTYGLLKYEVLLITRWQPSVRLTVCVVSTLHNAPVCGVWVNCDWLIDWFIDWLIDWLIWWSKFRVCKFVQHHIYIQINHPTRCISLSDLLPAF
jgi:hypothetical protein